VEYRRRSWMLLACVVWRPSLCVLSACLAATASHYQCEKRWKWQYRESLVYESSSLTIAPNTYRTRKYFLEEPGKERRELTFLHDVPVFDNCVPVDDTKLWVAASFFEMGMDAPITVLVFDGWGIVRARKLRRKSGAAKPFGIFSFKFGTGNRTVMYAGPNGLEAYDVVTDEVGPLNRRPD
jgi:hypothetical protein